MKFFIDTADINEIREAAAMGLVDGVTTNPSLVAKSKRKFKDVLLEICDIVKGPVSAEVTAVKHDEIMTEARELAKLKPNIVVKIPLIPEGLKAVRTCATEASLVVAKRGTARNANDEQSYEQCGLGHGDWTL